MSGTDREEFGSVEEFSKEFELNGCEFRFEYNEEHYQTWWYKGKVGLSDCKTHKWWEYNTLDEMLDNFKAKNGKTMREFILDVKGVF